MVSLSQEELKKKIKDKGLVKVCFMLKKEHVDYLREIKSKSGASLSFMINKALSLCRDWDRGIR